MMYLTQWDPFDVLSEVQQGIDQVFNRKTKNLLPTNQSKSWLPAVDIHEDKESFYFDVEIPGIKKEDIKVQLEDHVLTVRGERKEEKKSQEGGQAHRIERLYGSFARSFTLPETSDADKVKADYKEGILSIKVGKKEQAKPRQIQVQIS